MITYRGKSYKLRRGWVKNSYLSGEEIEVNMPPGKDLSAVRSAGGKKHGDLDHRFTADEVKGGRLQGRTMPPFFILSKGGKKGSKMASGSLVKAPKRKIFRIAKKTPQ